MDTLDDDILLRIWSFLGPAATIYLCRLSVVCRRFRALSQRRDADRALWAPFAESWTALGVAQPSPHECLREYSLRLSAFEASFLRTGIQLATTGNQDSLFPVDVKELDDSCLDILCILGTMLLEESSPLMGGLFGNDEQAAALALNRLTRVPLSYLQYIRCVIREALPTTRSYVLQWYHDCASVSITMINRFKRWFLGIASLAGNERGRRRWLAIDNTSHGLGSSPSTLFHGLLAISEVPSIRNSQLLIRTEIESFVRDCVRSVWRELGIVVGQDEESHEIHRLRVRSMNRLTVLSAIKYVFYDQCGFHGNVHDYYNIKNSLMHFVICDREGIPLTLCALFAYIATHAGMEKVFVLGLPGHVMLAVDLRTKEDFVEDKCYDGRCFVDCFNGGDVKDVAALTEFLRVPRDEDSWFLETPCIKIWLRAFK